MSEKVTYRGKTYVATRPIDREDEKLLTPQKQRVAKLYFYKGMSSKDIARILNVDENVLNVWHDNEARLEGISKSNKAFINGKAKRVICTNIETGEEVEYVSLSACAKACGCVASTILYKIKNDKAYKHYKFRYAE